MKSTLIEFWNNLSEKDKLGAKIILFGAGIIIIMIILFLILKAGKVVTDNITLCPKEPPSHFVILVDKSDPPNDSQLRQIKQRIGEVKDNLGFLDRLSIVTMGASGHANEIFSKCNPGRGEQANQFYENPTMVQNNFDKNFGSAFNNALEAAISEGKANASYIMESIQNIITNINFNSNISKRKLIIFSDMLQHSKKYSQYKQISTYKRFLETKYGQSLLTDMNDVEIVVYLIMRRDRRININSLVEFWITYFEEQGATPVTFSKLF